MPGIFDLTRSTRPRRPAREATGAFSRWALVVLFALSGLLLRPTPAAAGEIIEAVVATVNGTPIFLSTVRQRMVPFVDRIASLSSQAEKSTAMAQLRSQLVQALIHEELFRQEAKKLKITVANADVENAIKNVQEQAGVRGQAFWDAVAEQGLSQAQYRRELHQQLIRFKVLNLKVRSKVNISEDEIRRRYDKEIGREQRQMRFRVSHIFIALAEDATTTVQTETRKKAETLAASLNAANFANAMVAEGGEELGWLSQGDLPPELEAALLKLSPGQVSPATRGESGYHIFLLHERERGKAGLPSYEQAKQAILAQMMQEAMAAQEQLLIKELERKALIHMRD